MPISNIKRTDKTNIQNISFFQTGDPFVDTGGLVLKTIKENFQDKTLIEIIEFVTDIYIKQWHQKLHAIFHTNSKILNPSTKGKHRRNTLEYFKNLVTDIPLENSIDGFCKICGTEGRLYASSREFFPLSGSGAFVNFHHLHEIGSYLCNECSIKLFFVPLGVLQLGGNVGLLHTQKEPSKSFIIKEIIQKNLNKISRQTSEGILKSEFKNPRNALFEFATKIIEETRDKDYNDFLQLFHFSNFGADPKCDIYALPNPVFKFLKEVLSHHREWWYYFVQRHFFIAKGEWDYQQNTWTRTTKKASQTLAKEEYLNNRNIIFERLLANKSILPHLLNIYREHYHKNLKPIPLMFAIYYVTEVLNMSQEQLDLIRRIANVVFELSKKENNYKKYAVKLDDAKKAHQLRYQLLRIIKANYQNGAKEPLIRLEEYVNYLFPDGQYWGEIRDLLLIHLYEKFHDEGVNSEEVFEEDEEISETINHQPIDNY